MMPLISLFDFIAVTVELFSMAVLSLAFLRGASGWILQEIRRDDWMKRSENIRKLRCIVGMHILYALELMIISDLIHSFLAVVKSHGSYENFFQSDVFYSLIQLGMIVSIRTVIDYVLSREIDEIMGKNTGPQKL